jgi:hypothetical protein
MLAIVLISRLVFAIICAAIASSKGRSVVGWFFVGLLADLIGLIIILCMSNLKEQQAYREATAREQHRLREQLRQEQMKTESFRRYTMTRLDTHDEALGLDTRTATALPGSNPGNPMLAGGQGPALNGGGQGDSSITPQNPQGGQQGGQPGPLWPHEQANTYAADAAGQPTDWFYEVSGQTMGPVSENDVQQLIRAGRITPATLLWSERIGQWTAVSQLDPFRRAFGG